MSQFVETPEVRNARIELAACFRMAARMGMHEGICNHFSAVVPGYDDLFLVNPLGLSFDEITASNLLICNYDGQVIAGSGRPESTAFFIHARVHAKHPGAAACFHVHSVNGTALCMVDGEPFSWSSQTSLRYYNRLAVDKEFGGLALDEQEGDRIASALGKAKVIFLKNHGVMVVGRTIAEAWDDLYFVEKSAELECRALSLGRPLMPVSKEVAEATAQQFERFFEEAARLHLDSVRRRLDVVEPDYKD